MEEAPVEKKYTKAELLKKLTPKQKIFCHEYIIDWNKARAARAAGYSERTAKQIGNENFTKPYLQQYVDFIKHDYEAESGITKLRQLNELAKIAYSNISHLHDNWIELTDWEEIKKNNPNCLAAVEIIDTKTETKKYKTDSDDEMETEVEYVKLKLYPKIPAIAEINRMQGYHAPEKLKVDQSIIVKEQPLFSDDEEYDK
jgi:phage terminase small subunit